MPISILGLTRAKDNSQENLELTIDTLEDVALAEPLKASVKLVKYSHELLVAEVTLSAKVNVACDKCLSEFVQNLNTTFRFEFTDEPDESQWPITRDSHIDLIEPIRQEILFSLPTQNICQEECNGIA